MTDPIRIDQPIAGYYAMSLVRGGPLVPVKIWFGRPVLDGDELDRSPRWCCEIDRKTDREVDGIRELLDFDRAWPWCARKPIDEATYRYMVAHADWAVEHRPEHPKATPRKAVDWLNSSLPF
jgi:hypothetical protein